MNFLKTYETEDKYKGME
jgi:hypothetical protein